MDVFDDILPEATTARSRPGGKFAPKVKSKVPPRKEISSSEHSTPLTGKDSEEISQNECHNEIAAHPPQLELQNKENAVNFELGNSKQVGVDRNNARLGDDLPFMTAASEVVSCSDQNFTNFPKSTSGADSEGFEVGSVTKSIPEIDLNNGTTQPAHPPNAVESELNNVAAPSSTCSTIGGIEKPPKCGEDSFLNSNKNLEVLDSSNVFKSAPDENKTAISVYAGALELHPFSNVVLDPGPGTKNAHKFLPKIKPRPRLGNTPAVASASYSAMMEKSNELPTCSNEVQSSGDVGGRPNQSTSYQEVSALNHDSPLDNVLHCQSLKSRTNPSSEVPVHEELTKYADSPTLDDFLHQNVTREKEDANNRKAFLRKHGSSSITGVEDESGQTSSHLRRQATRKRTNNPLNEDVEDDDVLDPPYNTNRDEVEENGDEFDGVNYPSKKKRASTSSKKKPVAKTEKQSLKRKKANDNLDKTTKEPTKKLSRSTRRRCVDKALSESDELDYRTLRIRDIISLAEIKERLVKKKATTPKTNQSDGDFFHEAGANNEEDIFGSEDGRDPDDDHASERITSTTLLNYQSFMNKASRGRWSKQETEKFYEAIEKHGLVFSIIQHKYFPGKTPHQLKLKYKKEDRQNRLRLSDALNNRPTDYSELVEELQQAYSKEERVPSKDALEFMPGEEVEDLAAGTNEELRTAELEKVATAKQDDADVDEDFSTFHSRGQSDDDDNDDDELQRWSQYKSDF